MFHLVITRCYIRLVSRMRVISKIFEEDPRRAYIAFKYLEDMKKNLAEVYKVFCRYIIVVG